MAVGAANTLVKIALAHPVLPSCTESALPRGIDPESAQRNFSPDWWQKTQRDAFDYGKVKVLIADQDYHELSLYVR